MIKILDSNLKHFADIVKDQFNVNIDNIKGAGAAGGLGATLAYFFNGVLKSGIDLVIKH